MKRSHARLTALLAAAVAAASLAGCMTVGRPFPTDKVATIAVGKTTQRDLIQTYGHPFRTGLQDGDTTWTYLNYHLSVLGEQETTDLYLRFNADGTVKSYAFNTNAEPTTTAPAASR